MSGRNLHFLFFIILTFNLILLSNSNDSETGQALFICNKYTCPKNRGTCNENNECVCIKGYDTVDDLSKGDFYCNYRKKSKLITFLLEFVLGFGAGHFYLGNFFLATIKMIYTSLTCLIFCQFNNITKITEYKYVLIPFERYALAGWVLWQLVDGILIYFGIYKDGYGHEMKGW